MQVRILKEVFDSGNHLDALDNILTFFRKGRHSLLLDNIDDIEAYDNSDWKKNLNSRDIKLINAYLKSSTKINKAFKFIDISENGSESTFAPIEAERYLSQHLTILLENAEYDAPFTNAIFKHFDKDKTLLEAKLDLRWKYAMGGGSSIPSVINSEIAQSFNDACFTKAKKEYLRYFVILDSDKKFPTMLIDNSKHNILDTNGVPYHVLYKREKENYMPLEILKKLKSAYFDIYIGFKSHAQRDYFDIEKGFDSKPYDKLSTEIKELYPEKEFTEEQYKLLRNGIDLEQYKKGKIKKDFSKLYDEATRDQLFNSIKHQEKIDNFNEFEHIVNELKKIL